MSNKQRLAAERYSATLAAMNAEQFAAHSGEGQKPNPETVGEGETMKRLVAEDAEKGKRK